jgi:glycosyltransferase involved in cell wall biosynthesis
VSVIVPAYNAAAFLRAALESVRAQTYPQYQVVIADDGSTDSTSVIAQQFASADSRFHLLPQAHAGVSAARNRALQIARGDWIAFLDADDVWLPEKLERQTELSRTDLRANLLFTNYHLWNGEVDFARRYSKPAKLPRGEVSRKLIRGNLFGMSSVMIRRDALFRAGGFNPALSHGEDWDLWLRVAEDDLWARGIPEPLVRYRVWSGSASHPELNMAEANVRVLQERLALSQRSDLKKYLQRALARARARLELARVRPLLSDTPEALSPALLRAWIHDRRRLKWLIWYLATRWSSVHGGRLLTWIVRREICRHG